MHAVECLSACPLRAPANLGYTASVVWFVSAVTLHALQWAWSSPHPPAAAWLPAVACLAGLALAWGAGRVNLTQVAVVLGVCVAGRAAMLYTGAPAPCDVSRLLDGGTRSASRHLLEGDILAASRSRSGSLRWRLRTDGASCGRVLVTVRHAERTWRAGRRVRLRSYLRRIENFGNPGEFDYAAWNRRRGMLVSAYVWSDREVEDLGPAGGAVAALARLRDRVEVAAGHQGGAGGALLRALLVGDRDGLRGAREEAFRRAGLAHVLAISGLHVGILAAATVLVVRAGLLWLLPSFAAAHDVQRPAALAAGLVVAAYGLLSGGGVSVLRAVIMGELALLALWRGSPEGFPSALAQAALCLAFLLPGVVREASFQLSFAAVAALLAYQRWVGEKGTWSTRAPGPRLTLVLGASLAAWYATVPLTAQHFGRVSLLGPVLTPLILAPLGLLLGCGFTLSAAVLLSVPGAQGLLDALAAGAGLLVGLVAWIAQLPACSWRVVAPGWGLVAVWLAAPGLLWMAPAARRRACIGLAVLAAVFVLHGAVERFRSDRLDIVFVSVGQGDSTLLRFPGGKVVLVDTGPPGRGRLAVLPLLDRMWIRRVDLLVLTHLQADHWGAAGEVLEGAEIGEIWRPGGSCSDIGFAEFRRRARERGVTVREVVAGATFSGASGDSRWSLGVLSPSTLERDCADNDASVVLRVEFAGHSALLTGDAEAAVESELLAAGARVHADLLKLGHHGSRTSSTAAFVDAVAPRIAVASLGLDNRYGFPHERVRSLFESLAVRLYRTDLDGAVTARLSRSGIAVRTTKPRGSG